MSVFIRFAILTSYSHSFAMSADVRDPLGSIRNGFKFRFRVGSGVKSEMGSWYNYGRRGGRVRVRLVPIAFKNGSRVRFTRKRGKQTVKKPGYTAP